MTTDFQTLAWIRETGGPRSWALTKGSSPTLIGHDSFLTWKNGCCYCGAITSAEYFKVDVVTHLPSDGVGTEFTHAGYDAILEHENDRVAYFRRGYAAFLEPLKNVAMGGIGLCMNMPGAAKQKLQAFLNRWRTHAEISYQLYISRERTGVETDNIVGNHNYDAHGLFIGFKSMYQVQDAQYTPPTPEKGNCPTNP